MSFTPPDNLMDNLAAVTIPPTPPPPKSARMLRVYVAGAYSSDNVLGVLSNMRHGLALSVKVMKAGFAPFAPWLDFQYGLLDSFSVKEYQAVSIAWLEVCDAMIVQPIGAEQSNGTIREIARAQELGIPVFYTIDTLERWRDGR